MSRFMRVAAGQLGAIPEGTRREECVGRMLGLLEQAIAESVELVVFPELALTPYFPKRLREDYDQLTTARRRWNFLGRRHPEHYGLITQPVRQTP